MVVLRTGFHHLLLDQAVVAASRINTDSDR